MTVKEAISILELTDKDLDLKSIKSAYRRLSKKYHPDHTGKEDSTKFLLVNAAYEYLKQWLVNNGKISAEEIKYSDDETINELEARIQAIDSIFETMVKEYENYHNHVFNRMVNLLINQLNSYVSHRDLKQNINQQFKQIVNNGINSIINWFNQHFEQIIKNYDDWLYGFMRQAYEDMKNKELLNKYKSPLFKKHIYFGLTTSLFIFIIFIILRPIFDFNFLLILTIPLFGLYVSNKFYLNYVDKIYHLDTNITKLEVNKFKLDPSSLIINLEDRIADYETGGLGAAGGAALGMMVGGPLGAIAGGIIGGIFGSFLGQSLEELKEETFKKLIENLKVIDENIIQSLNTQLFYIRNELIETIKKNYKYNKKKTVLMLISPNYKSNFKDNRISPGLEMDKTDSTPNYIEITFLIIFWSLFILFIINL